MAALEIQQAVLDESWRPGRLNPNLSWTHYRSLLHVEPAEARTFYEIEAAGNAWSEREPEVLNRARRLRQGMLPDELMKEFLETWQIKRDESKRGLLEVDS